MKKIYLAPEVVVVKTTPTTIIATSSPNAGIDKLNEIAPEDFETRQNVEWDVWTNEEGNAAYYDEYYDYEDEY